MYVATKGESLPRPPIDQTLFRLNIYTLKISQPHIILNLSSLKFYVPIPILQGKITRHDSKWYKNTCRGNRKMYILVIQNRGICP